MSYYYALFISSKRSRRTLESRQNMDDDKIAMLEDQLKQLKSASGEYERKYEEVRVTKKLFVAFALFCVLLSRELELVLFGEFLRCLLGFWCKIIS